MNELPNLPSELLLAALDDLHACEEDPRYVIDMGYWHRPNTYCHVCLAGAVMAKTLQCPISSNFVPSMVGSGYASHLNLSVEQKRVLENKLLAIDRFRSGYIESALDILNVPKPDAIPVNMKMHEYRISRTDFYNDMNQLITLFKQHGC